MKRLFLTAVFTALVVGNLFAQVVTVVDTSHVGVLTRTFSAGALTSVTSPAGPFYGDGAADRTPFKNLAPDGAPPPPQAQNKNEPTGFRVARSRNDIYLLKNFTLDSGINLRIPEAHVLLGHTKVGYFEAVIIPTEPVKIDFKGTSSARAVSGEIESIYLRFLPDDVPALFGGKLYASGSLPAGLLERLGRTATTLFAYQMHTGRDALLFMPHRITFARIKDRGIYLIERSFNGRSEIEVSEHDEQGRLKIAGASQAQAPGEMLKKQFKHYTSGPITVYYDEKSALANWMAAWTARRVAALDTLYRVLGVAGPPAPVSMFVFDNPDESGRSGILGGFAVPERSEVYTLANQTIGHELAHVVSYRIAGKRVMSVMANEGLATYLSLRGPQWNYHRISQKLLQDGTLDTCDLSNNGFRNCAPGYFLGASFIGWLIETRGLDMFKAFFTRDDLDEDAAFLRAYGKSMADLVTDWKAFLRAGSWGELTAPERNMLSQLSKTASN